MLDEDLEFGGVIGTFIDLGSIMVQLVVIVLLRRHRIFHVDSVRLGV